MYFTFLLNTNLSIRFDENLAVEVGALSDLSLAADLALLKTALWMDMNPAPDNAVVKLATGLEKGSTHLR